MNKKVMMAIGAMAIAAFLGLIVSQNLSVSAGPDLSEDEVKQKVESQYPGEITALELEKDGKDPVYKVELVIDGKEYELQIDANSGEVLKLDEKMKAEKEGKQETASASEIESTVEIKEKAEDKADGKGNSSKEAADDDKNTGVKVSEKETAEPKQEINNENKNAEQDANKESDTAKVTESKETKTEKKRESKTSDQEKKSIISEKQAIEIALKQFSGKVEDIELDKDDGRLIYEIEMESSKGEAEIEIDAYTGEVIMVDIELEEDDD